MFCPKCGANVPEGSDFCWDCGTAIRSHYKETLEPPITLRERHSLSSIIPPRLGRVIWYTLWVLVFIVVLMLPILLDSLLGFILCFLAGIVALTVYCVRHGLKRHRERENKPQFDNAVYTPVQSMTGLEYEHWCAKRLAESGKFLKVTVTPPTGDFGADIVAVDAAKRTWVVQCKHYRSKLGNSPIQEVVSAKAHYGAECAAVVTNSTFTEKAKQLARENRVKLYEHIDGSGSHKQKWKNYSVEEMMFYDDIFN